MLALVAAFWLVGLACLIAALAAGGGPVKIGSVELPAFGTRVARGGVAVIGVLALALGGVLFFHRDPAPTVPVTDGPTGVRSTPKNVNSAVSASGDAAVVFHEPITMAYGSSVNVGALPITVAGSFVGSSIYFYDGVLNSGNDNGLSPWDADDPPTPAACANNLRIRSVRTLRPRTGVGFCLKGNDGVPRVAYGKITSFDEVKVSLEIDLTVWNVEL